MVYGPPASATGGLFETVYETSKIGRQATVEFSDDLASQPLPESMTSSQPLFAAPSTQAWTAGPRPVMVTGVSTRSRPLPSVESVATLASTSSIEMPDASVFHVSVSTHDLSRRCTDNVASTVLKSAATKVSSAETTVAPAGI